MATWYAQLSAASFFAVSGGSTSSQWNAAADGSGEWLDLTANYAADTFNANGATDIALDANVTASTLTSAGDAGTWLLNTTGVTITANLIPGTTYTFLMNSGTPAVTITGNLLGGTGSSDMCVRVTVAGTLTINGTVTGGSNTSANALYIQAAATVTINGTVTGGSVASAYGVMNDTADWGSLTVNGTVTATAAAAILATRIGSPAVVVTGGNIVDTAAKSAIQVVSGVVFAPGAGNYYRMRTTGATTIDLRVGGGSGGGVFLTRTIGMGA